MEKFSLGPPSSWSYLSVCYYFLVSKKEDISFLFESGPFWSAKKLKLLLASAVVTTYCLKRVSTILKLNVDFQWVLVLSLLDFHLEKLLAILLARYMHIFSCFLSLTRAISYTLLYMWVCFYGKNIYIS